jgi:ribose 5-phosphate isomerase
MIPARIVISTKSLGTGGGGTIKFFIVDLAEKDLRKNR